MKKEIDEKWIKDHEYLHYLLFISLKNLQTEAENNFMLVENNDKRLDNLYMKIKNLERKNLLNRVCMLTLALLLILLMLSKR